MSKLHFCAGCNGNYSCEVEDCMAPNLFPCDHHLELVKNKHMHGEKE